MICGLKRPFWFYKTNRAIIFLMEYNTTLYDKKFMLHLKNNKETLDIAGYTVIIPSICVGNAAQLACDILIASKQLHRIGNITHPALIPVYGPSAYQHEPEEKSAACEVYESSSDKLLVIQFRTPLISRHTPQFHKALVQLVKPAQRVILLGASFGFEKRVIESSPYAYCLTNTFKETHPQLQKMPWTEFTGDVIHGCGNGMQLFKLLDKEGVTVMLLFRYLLEGDNALDASLIIKELNDLCENFLEIQGDGDSLKLTVPESWKLLFGNEATGILF